MYFRHCQVLSTIQAYSQWLSQFHQAVLEGLLSNELLDYFISSTIQSILPLISHDVPEKISLSACQLLESLTTTIRYTFCLIIEFQHALGISDLICKILISALPPSTKAQKLFRQ